MNPNPHGGPSHPKVSIVMVTYNHANWIAQAIESVLSQEADFEYELLIGEDRSTDNTREICRQYAQRRPDRIVLTLREHNVGVFANWSGLFQAARGDFIAFCEGDDYWTSPHKLAKQVRAMEQNPGWAGCFHKTRVIHADGSEPDRFLPAQSPGSEVSLRQIVADNCIATCSIMYRRGVAPKIPDWFATLAMGDWPLHILHAMHGPLGYLDEEMGVYRLHRGGIWTSMDQAQRLDHTLRMWFTIESHSDKSLQPLIAQGRREHLSRLLETYEGELARLHKIEARYRALQLHRLAAIGQWLKRGKRP